MDRFYDVLTTFLGLERRAAQLIQLLIAITIMHATII